MVIEAVLVIQGYARPPRGDSGPLADDWEDGMRRLLNPEEAHLKTTLKALAELTAGGGTSSSKTAAAIERARVEYVRHATFSPAVVAGESRAAEVRANIRVPPSDAVLLSGNDPIFTHTPSQSISS